MTDRQEPLSFLICLKKISSDGSALLSFFPTFFSLTAYPSSASGGDIPFRSRSFNSIIKPPLFYCEVGIGIEPVLVLIKVIKSRVRWTISIIGRDFIII